MNINEKFNIKPPISCKKLVCSPTLKIVPIIGERYNWYKNENGEHELYDSSLILITKQTEKFEDLYKILEPGTMVEGYYKDSVYHLFDILIEDNKILNTIPWYIRITRLEKFTNIENILTISPEVKPYNELQYNGKCFARDINSFINNRIEYVVNYANNKKFCIIGEAKIKTIHKYNIPEENYKSLNDVPESFMALIINKLQAEKPTSDVASLTKNLKLQVINKIKSELLKHNQVGKLENVLYENVKLVAAIGETDKQLNVFGVIRNYELPFISDTFDEKEHETVLDTYYNINLLDLSKGSIEISKLYKNIIIFDYNGFNNKNTQKIKYPVQFIKKSIHINNCIPIQMIKDENSKWLFCMLDSVNSINKQNSISMSELLNCFHDIKKMYISKNFHNINKKELDATDEALYNLNALIQKSIM